jgi:hypothetical protein
MYYTNGKNFVFNHLLYIFYNAFKAKIKSFILNSIVPEVTFKCEQDPLVYNRIGGVMVSVLASSVVDRVFDLTDRVKLKTIKLVSVASLLSTQHLEDRAKTGWLRIRIMCPSGATCLFADCYFSELALYKFN